MKSFGPKKFQIPCMDQKVPFWQFFRQGQDGCALLVQPSRIPHRISKILFALGADEFLANGCKHFKVSLQLFYGSEGNYKKPLINENISGIERLVLPFPDTEKYLCLLLPHKPNQTLGMYSISCYKKKKKNPQLNCKNF